jgi:hypothetical protein
VPVAFLTRGPLQLGTIRVRVGRGSPLNPGLYADVYGASWGAGDEIDQWYWNGGWNQFWQFTQAVG